jgi:high-affinity Fe2+/Pb2+ permease
LNEIATKKVVNKINVKKRILLCILSLIFKIKYVMQFEKKNNTRTDVIISFMVNLLSAIYEKILSSMSKDGILIVK